MSFASTLPLALLETILGRLALLFLSGAGGDITRAQDAARQMLAAYHPQTEDELRLAAEIVSFSLHVLEALSQASTPDMPLNKILRLRGCAVSLSRESHKAQRKLDQLQRDRRAGVPIQPEQPVADASAPRDEATPARPQIDKAIALIEATREVMATASKAGNQTWTQSYQQRQRAKRIVENLKKNQGSHAAANSAPMPEAAPQ